MNDDKTLHEEEERRLFYVAMTRAKDTLAIYAHQGRGKKDPKPTQFLREFMVHPAYKKFWSTHPAAAVQDRLFAEEEQRIAVQQSTVAAWLLMPPSASFVTGLSASAIEIYEECPLRFKLEREWNLPRDVPASLHYGAAMHGVLRTFYDAQRYQRAISDDDLLEQFRAALASAGIADRYQYELYLRQGMEQLRQFFEWARSAEPPEVIETERRFELQVGSAKLAGRVDRIDRTGPDSVAIVDYKTGKPKSQEDADKSLQLSLYALAARETWGKRADRLIFHNLENNTPVYTTRTDAELEAAKLRVQEASDGIAQGNFAAKPGYQCSYCPYRNLCPATEKIVGGKTVAREDRRSSAEEIGVSRQLVESDAVRLSGACGTKQKLEPQGRTRKSPNAKCSPGNRRHKKLWGRSSRPLCRCLLQVLSASCCSSSLLSFWLPWIYSPFPFFMEFRNGVLLQLIDV